MSHNPTNLLYKKDAADILREYCTIVSLYDAKIFPVLKIKNET